MILVKLKGGLGNQMFQYALGRAISVGLGAPLSVDTSFYNEVTKRSFSLEQFDIKASVASEKEINRISSPMQKVFDLLRRHKHIIVEKSPRFDPDILNAPDNSYFEGYWQSEKYFSHITEKLLGDFGLKKTFGSYAADFARLMGNSNAVSVHIRRGDYVANPKFTAVHGVLPLDYYKRAMALIEEKVDDPRYFVFSDDPAWVEENLDSEQKIDIVSGSGTTEGEELRLMTLCRHHIIANSSFSWWGAWLNQKPGKIVVAPKQWMLDTSKDTSDIVPEEWIKI